MIKAERLLNEHWGYDSFLPFQKETVQSVLDSRDSLTVLPTGGGKSLCFQLPALLKEGTVIVISPTKSLMQDQVLSMNDIGVESAYWNSSLTPEQINNVKKRTIDGEVKLLYITPERLCRKSMLPFLNQIKISFFVIDEAHCISQWGHSFRPEYRKLSLIKAEFPDHSVHAFTASATIRVQTDIVDQLKLKDPNIYIGKVDRPNLTYRMFYEKRGRRKKQIETIIDQHQNQAGIIYCSTRKDVDELSAYLNERGFENLPYHAGLPDDIREKNQKLFSNEEVNLIVATIAFGLGIDRSDIRFIIHAGMPKNLEQYSQETGRAGRDGLNSSCYLFFSSWDYRLGMYFVENDANSEELKKKLYHMYGNCISPQCRHRVLSEYFGQAYNENNCNACDYCLNELALVENPEFIARKILNTVRNTRTENYSFGAMHICNILKGKVNEQISRNKHDALEEFGSLADKSIEYIRYMIEQIIGKGFLMREGEYSTLTVTDQGENFFNSDQDITLAEPISLKATRRSIEEQRVSWEKDHTTEEKELFEKLRNKRHAVSKVENVPAFIVFNDKTLWDMASKKPLNPDDFLNVYGVGKEKQKKYAEDFISVIKKYIENN